MNNSLGDEWIRRLGPAVRPFERDGFKNRNVKEGEDIIFTDAILLVSDSRLIYLTVTSVESILATRPMQSKYLWIIDEQGLKLILESTPNPYAARGVVCHTNITGGSKALQGSELWFGDDSKLYLNFKSGRYGAFDGEQGISHKLAVMEFLQSLNFDPVQLDNGF